MAAGHGRRRADRAARIADSSLGVVWVLFAWSVLGGVVHLVLIGFGVGGADRARIVAVAVAAISAVLLAWGHHEAMRVPRVKRVDVHLPRLGGGLDGTRVVVLADTHYGPIDRAGWSARVAEAVNALDADVVFHAGDIADGTPAQRREQSAPLGDRSGHGWRRSTSPATTSTSARPRAGWTAWRSWAGSRCTTATSWWSAAATASCSPAWTT